MRYTVTYTELPNGPEQTQNVTAPTTNARLTSLNEYTNYSITVFASTVKGDGNVSAPIIVITDEDSEFTFLIYFTPVLFSSGGTYSMLSYL